MTYTQVQRKKKERKNDGQWRLKIFKLANVLYNGRADQKKEKIFQVIIV